MGTFKGTGDIVGVYYDDEGNPVAGPHAAEHEKIGDLLNRFRDTGNRDEILVKSASGIPEWAPPSGLVLPPSTEHSFAHTAAGTLSIVGRLGHAKRIQTSANVTGFTFQNVNAATVFNVYLTVTATITITMSQFKDEATGVTAQNIPAQSAERYRMIFSSETWGAGDIWVATKRLA